MNVKQISVVLDEQSGSLCGIAKILAGKNVDMRALTVSESGNFRIVHIIVDNVLWALSALWEAGFTANMADVLAVEVPDEAEGLVKVLDALERGGIDVKYMYPVLSRKKTLSLGGGMPVLVFKLSDEARAEEILNAEGIKVLSQAELSMI